MFAIEKRSDFRLRVSNAVWTGTFTIEKPSDFRLRVLVLSALNPTTLGAEARDEAQPEIQEWPRQTKPKKGQFMNFSQGRSGTKVQCESCLFS